MTEIVYGEGSRFPRWEDAARELSREQLFQMLSSLTGGGGINEDDAIDAVLAVCAWEHVTGQPNAADEYDEEQVYHIVRTAQSLGISLNEQEARFLYQALEDRGWAWEAELIPDYEEDSGLTDDYEKYVTLSPGGLARGLGVLWELKQTRFINAYSKYVPTADGFVDFTHNQPDVSDVIAKIEASEEVIRSSNTLSPEDKSLFAATLEAGKKLLSGPRIYLAAASALLIKPLYDAYCSVIEEAAKPIIEAALHALKLLLGL